MLTPGGVEYAMVTASEGKARVDLSFGPTAWVQLTDDQDGFVFVACAGPVGVFTTPVVRVRVRFGPDCKPIVDQVEVRTDGY